jgi:hypothetical protein
MELLVLVAAVAAVRARLRLAYAVGTMLAPAARQDATKRGSCSVGGSPPDLSGITAD